MATLQNKRVIATEEEISEGNNGICLACGEEAYGVEPDARAYECECCGKRAVYGLEELVVMGFIDLTDDDGG
jgi:hypothetical protein